MSEEPRHEALVGAAVLGVVKAKGWMQVPLVVDVNRAIAEAGPLRISREDAISFTRGLMDLTCEVHNWPLPVFAEVEEAAVRYRLGLAYDELVAAEAARS